MIGAIAGDIIGSVYEWENVKTTDFDLFDPRCRFTDDTVMTVAVADCILSGREYSEVFREYGRRYPDAGYGGLFRKWLFSRNPQPYNSYGNGSAMRVSPVGFASSKLEAVIDEAKKSAKVTHNHAEGIKGAQAVASAIFLAREGKNKEEIQIFIKDRFGYDLHKGLDDIRPGYSFDVTCQGSVPEAIIAFLESLDYEDAVRKAVSLGGDSDTIACITGGIAQAYYKHIPRFIVEKVRGALPADFLKIVDDFNNAFGVAI